MDPVALATVTSAVTMLASEAGKGLAGDAGKDLWGRVRSVLGWKEDPPMQDVAPKVAARLQGDEQAAREIVQLLQGHSSSSGAAAIVGNVSAEKMTVIGQQHVAGDFTLNM
jgi:hypothetical protein